MSLSLRCAWTPFWLSVDAWMESSIGLVVSSVPKAFHGAQRTAAVAPLLTILGLDISHIVAEYAVSDEAILASLSACVDVVQQHAVLCESGEAGAAEGVIELIEIMHRFVDEMRDLLLPVIKHEPDTFEEVTELEHLRRGVLEEIDSASFSQSQRELCQQMLATAQDMFLDSSQISRWGVFLCAPGHRKYRVWYEFDSNYECDTFKRQVQDNRGNNLTGLYEIGAWDYTAYEGCDLTIMEYLLTKFIFERAKDFDDKVDKPAHRVLAADQKHYFMQDDEKEDRQQLERARRNACIVQQRRERREQQERERKEQLDKENERRTNIAVSLGQLFADMDAANTSGYAQMAGHLKQLALLLISYPGDAQARVAALDRPAVRRLLLPAQSLARTGIYAAKARKRVELWLAGSPMGEVSEELTRPLSAIERKEVQRLLDCMRVLKFSVSDGSVRYTTCEFVFGDYELKVLCEHFTYRGICHLCFRDSIEPNYEYLCEAHSPKRFRFTGLSPEMPHIARLFCSVALLDPDLECTVQPAEFLRRNPVS